MSKLELRIDKYMDDDEGNPPLALARILAIDATTGRARLPSSVRREMIPISLREEDFRSIEVDPGTYFVEVALPSGEILADRVDVPAASSKRLALTAEHSPHEWLSWQHLAGNVALKPIAIPARPALPKEPAVRKKAVDQRSKSSTRPQTGMGHTLRADTSALKRTAPRPLGLGKHRQLLRDLAANAIPGAVCEFRILSQPIGALLGGTGGDPWTALASMTGSSSEIPLLLNSGYEPLRIQPQVIDGPCAHFLLLHGSDFGRRAVSLGSTLQRAYAIVERSGGTELVSLPTPWAQLRSGREAIIDIAVQTPQSPNEFATTITVHDEQFSLLLGFISSGALGRAQEITDIAREMLFFKIQNSLAAAAGAYAMVGTATDNQEKEWHQWIRNLSQWFPHLPDGSIQLAYLHLRMRRNPTDLSEAARLLKEGFRRGLPYYTMGVRWLLDGLEKVSRFDPEAAQMHEQVRLVARTIHPQSPFTVIRLGST